MAVTPAKYRKKIVAGNWKMNKSIAEARELAEAVARDFADCRDVEVVLCPPFTALKTVGDVIGATTIKLGAQDMHWEKDGAFTGEISAAMLRDLYCHYVIVGHSERRAHFGETDAKVNRKLRAALAGNLRPILCVGETLDQREAGRMQEVVEAQLRRGLADAGEQVRDVIVAYEPVWAIGTGRNATPEQAQEMHAFIRGVLAGLSSREVADALRIQYGGSIKPANARELLTQPDVDGGLVGGASLDARSFGEIVKAAL